MKSIVKIRSVWLIILSILLFSVTASAGHLVYFTGNLDGNQEIPPSNKGGTGFGRVTLDKNTNMVNVSVYYNNLSSNLTIGHIHGPAAPGDEAGVIWDLVPTPGQTSGAVLNAQFSATPQQIADLFAGLLYFNLHTADFSGGEIRGQIFLDSPYVATLDGNQENPNVKTRATGGGVVSLNQAGDLGLVTVAWGNLTANATGGHIHQAQSGINGPIICNLVPPAVQTGIVSDFLCNFTQEQTEALQQGLLYFNIHSSMNTGGEIRGQIQRQNSNRINLDSDDKTDISIFRPAVGEWWYLQSVDLLTNAFQFGQSDDIPVPKDYTGDGKDDIGFFRPSNSEWFVLRSEDSSFFSFPFGADGDIPAPGDYDGDGKADSAVFRPSNSTWFINRSSDGGITIQPFGVSGDVPIVNDYDGDGKDDLSIFRPSASEWFVQDSGSGMVRGFQFGSNGDKPVPSDYTGDGKADIAFFRPLTGEWFILRSEDVSFFGFPFGTSGDIPVPGDYDGDGKADPSVFRPSNSTWFLQQSNEGFRAIQFGTMGDVPLPD